MTGSLAYDFIMDFPGKFSEHIDPSKLHILNISFLVDTLKKLRGGTAGNIAYNLALFEIPTSILATVGEDFVKYREFLDKAGVDTSLIRVIKDETTSQANIITDKDDNQITAFYAGAMKYASKLSIEGNNFSFCVVSPSDPKALLNFSRQALKKNIPYMFDPGMQLPRLSDDKLREGISGATILIGNDYEMGIVLKRLSSSISELVKKTKIVITTLGKEGSLINTDKEKLEIKSANPKEVIDPTGAGDAYRAGFLAGYLKGFDLKICGKMGSLAACYAIEKYGTTNHTFSLEEFKSRYKENYGEDLKYEIRY